MTTEIPGFTIERLLGEGSMGVVYLAQQWQPQRRVALKVLRVHSPRFAQRFRREADSLALLEHPHIARVYASGGADGEPGETPWLAMEYVEGTDLLQAVQALPLSGQDKTQRILKLLAAIARGVHFAHLRGVVHRDLKPGNILVDAEGHPKILDFGVAHLMGDADFTAMTHAGEVLGTIPYMSWEQLTGDLARVDARSDVYSLGVMAYELLAGRHPYPGLSQSTMVSAVERLAREVPVALGKAAPVAKDIETVVMKAMAPEPERRYSSAAEFAADIERYLDHRPVEARPPTMSYVAGLFVRRHKALSVAAGVSLLALIGASVVSTSFAVAEYRARAEAEQRASEFNAVNQFLENMLSSADPDVAQGAALTVREVLDDAVAELGKANAMPPSVAAALRQTLGKTYTHLALHEPAQQLLGEARILASEAWPLERRMVLEADYANALYLTDAFEQALAVAQAGLNELEALTGPRPQAYWLLQEAVVSNLIESGQVSEARQRLETVQAEAAQVLGADAPTTLNFLQLASTAYRLSGDYERALALAQQVYEKRKGALGAEHPETLQSQNNMATHLSRLGRQDEAIQILRDVLATRQKVLGDEHIDVWRTQANLSVALSERAAPGDVAEAATLNRSALAQYAARYGRKTRYALTLINNLAMVERDVGNLPAGEQLLREALATRMAMPVTEHADLYMIEMNLALNLKDQQRYTEALSHYRSSLEKARQGLPPEHPHIYAFQANYGHCLLLAGQKAAGIAELEQAVPGLEKTFGPDHSRTVTARNRLQAARAGVVQ